MKTDPAANPVPAETVGRSWSITSRLTWHYTLSTIALLLLAAGFLYWGLQRSLRSQDARFVASKGQVLRLLLREEHSRPDMLVGEVEHEAAEAQSLKYYLRVIEEDGRVIIETTGMQELLPVGLFLAPVPARTVLTGGQSIERKLTNGRTYLLLAAEAVEGGETWHKRVVQIGLDVSHNRELLTDYRRQLLLMLCGGIILAAAVGVVVARTGLRPLAKIAGAAQRITASKLDERVSAGNWPTELNSLAAAFDGMLDRLKESFTRLSDCTGDMAHALRNPINNLRGETEVALAQERTPEDYQQTLASNLEEYERLSRMIDGLLFIARTDNPGATLARSRFAARHEMDAVREFYEALAGEKGVVVVCEGEAGVSGDSMLFRRAVSNLLANALKHTPVGGRVLVSAQELADGTALIRVRDSGPGIAREHQSRLFDRFYQVNKSPDQTVHGAGLGLAIVQSIMRLHQGKVMLDSLPGQGTTVSLQFPAASPAAV